MTMIIIEEFDQLKFLKTRDTFFNVKVYFSQIKIGLY